MPKKVSIPKRDGSHSGTKKNPAVSVKTTKAGTQTTFKDGTGYWNEKPKKKK